MDVLDRPFAGPEADRLEELRIAVVEDRAEAQLGTGQFDRAVTELTRLTGERRLDERAAALLMHALYAAGRQADALAAYHRVRGALAELGVDPGPDLEATQRLVLKQDISLRGTRASEAAVRWSLPAPRSRNALPSWPVLHVPLSHPGLEADLNRIANAFGYGLA